MQATLILLFNNLNNDKSVIIHPNQIIIPNLKNLHKEEEKNKAKE